MKKDELFNECWQDLANAVVLQAVADYRWTQKLLKQKSDNCEKRLELHRLESFCRCRRYRKRQRKLYCYHRRRSYSYACI